MFTDPRRYALIYRFARRRAERAEAAAERARSAEERIRAGLVVLLDAEVRRS